MAEQGVETTTVDNTRFAWKKFENSSTTYSIKVVGEALDAAVEHSSKLKETLKSAIMRAKSDPDLKAFEVLSVPRLTNWLEEIEDLVQRSRKLEVLVGVAGDSGLGKTALLNALLGFRDLLPSSNQSAATATVCQVAWNPHPSSKKLFRAEIVFRSLEDVREELEKFFDDLTTRREMQRRRDQQEQSEDEGMNSDESADLDQDDIGEVEASIGEGLEKIEAIWGLDEEQVESMSAAEVLDAHSELTSLLSTTEQVWNSDQKAFSKRIKPYLDSTDIDIGGKQYKIWPLIDHVKLFVKADILKDGVVLVDLPGLSDATGTRSAVAMKFFQRLDITCIVSPGHRGADNKSATQLIGSNLEMAMRLDGKFNSQRFCAVLTKIDDIDYSSFVNDSREAQTDLGLQEAAHNLEKLVKKCKELTADLQEKEKALDVEEQNLARAKSDIERLDISSAKYRKATEVVLKRKNLKVAEASFESHKASVLDVTRKLALKSRRARYHEGCLVHQCIRARNAFLKQKIVLGYNKAQKRLNKKAGVDENDHDTIQVFPTSARVFWKLGDDPQNPPTGFCDLRYTGIPRFQAWIRTTTIPQRMTHARALLNSFHELLNQIETWSNDECQDVVVRVDRGIVQRDHMEPLYSKIRENLDNVGKDLDKKVQQCDPLHNKSKAAKGLRKTVVDAVERWCYIEPRDLKCHVKMHWLTFQAIINVHGAVFRSKGKLKKTYTWMEDMATDFFEDIVEMWHQALHVKLPKQEGFARRSLETSWNSALKDLSINLTALFPAEKSYLDKQVEGLLPIKEKAKDMVCECIGDVSAGSAGVHAEVSHFLQSKWDAAFEKASKDRGKGQYKRQRESLRRFAVRNTTSVYEKCIKSVNQKLKDDMDAFPQNLDEAWNACMGDFRNHVDLILDNIFATAYPEAENPEAMSKEMAFQHEIRQHIILWKVNWRESVVDGLTVDVDIPEVYGESLYSDNAAAVDEEVTMADQTA